MKDLHDFYLISPRSLSRQKRFSPSPKHLKLNLFNFLTLSSVSSLHSSSGMMFSHSLSYISCIFYLTFGVVEHFWGFSKLMSLSQIFGMGIYLNDLKSSCITSHEHFNYIFMHYRCVLYTLNCCVLLDLDWAKPMIFLNLHVTCSCIFMHTYLQLFIFLYIILLVLFWLSLTLSCVSLLYGT